MNNRGTISQKHMENKTKITKMLQPIVRSIRLKPIGGAAEFALFKPQDLTNFEIILEVFVGIEDGGEGVERFDVTVCTHKWISENINEQKYLFAHGMLIIPECSYAFIVECIESYVRKCRGNNIADVMRRVGLLGEWESEWEMT